MNLHLASARKLALCIAAWTGIMLSTAVAVDVTWLATGTSDYNTLANWSTGELPTADFFNERGVINNGGTALLTSPAGANPGGILLGGGGANSGTLEIGSGGQLISEIGVPPSGAPVTGYIEIGAAGTGTLRVLPGGTLQAPGLVVGGNVNSSLLLGGAGAGTATITIDGLVTLGRNTHISPNAALTTTAGGPLSLSPTSRYTMEVTSGGNATPNVSGPLALDGTLTVEINGITATAASSWNLFEASSISGSFSSISFNQNIPLATHQRWTVSDVPAGGGRRISRLAAEQVLVLNVDRDSGEISLTNPGGASLDVQAYSVRSAGGHLLPGDWLSLDEQNILGGDWLEANPTAARLTELKTNGVTTLSSGADHSIGNAFNLAVLPFGVHNEDITFDYVTTNGVVRTGNVQYLGAFSPNNLLLTVDPATGEAEIRNTSSYTVAIDSYSIRSASGALDVAGWSSLDDQNAAGGDWLEANPTANRLSEVKADDETTLVPETSYLLGNLFTTGSLQDLTFEFLLDGQSQPMQGIVNFAPLPTDGPPGDYDNNGVVNSQDYVTWRQTFGASVAPGAGADGNGDSVVDAADYVVWRKYFESNPGSGGTAVPEPSSMALLLISIVSSLSVNVLSRGRRTNVR